MGTVIVGAIVLGVVGLAVRSIMKDKKVDYDATYYGKCR